MIDKYNIEEKYICSKKLIDKIESFCKLNGKLDNHCYQGEGYIVHSNYKFISCGNKKKKIRLRKYSTKNTSDFFIEMKTKYDGNREKIHNRISQKNYNILLLSNNIKDFFIFLDTQQSDDDSFEEENLEIKYYRMPWIINNNNCKIRITYDKILEINNEKVCLDFYILEIKYKNSNSSAVLQIKEKFNLRNCNISKYKLCKKYSENINAFDDYINGKESN